jgi:hypothetical protein
LNLLELKQQAGIQDNPDQEGLDLFAELIVRECAGICHKMAEDSDSYVVHDGDTCAEQIKKHFGVEE